MKKLIGMSAVFGLLALGTTAFADLPNDRWSYDDPVVTGGTWEQTGNTRTVGAATFVEWERTTTTTEEALNPAGIAVGTDRFDRTTETTETTERNQNAGPPPN
jgi:hypothetical protein